jgi:hypothetical protein
MMGMMTGKTSLEFKIMKTQVSQKSSAYLLDKATWFNLGFTSGGADINGAKLLK